MMGTAFNVFEVLEIAEKIERNGGKYYRKAAGLVTTEECKELMLYLARMEDDHVATFSQMKKELPEVKEDTGFTESYGEAMAYLELYADGQIFQPSADPSETLTGEETMADIIRRAIGFERDSIAFYVGIKAAVLGSGGEEQIERIIREEMGHAKTLSDELARLQRG